MITVAGAMIVREGEVLLGRRAPWRRICPDRWDLFGGHAEPGESPLETLSRELGEELGVRPLDPRPVAVIDFGPEAGEPLHYHIFRVGRTDGEPRLANAEHTALAWFPLLEAARLPDLASSRYRRFLREAARTD